MNLIILSLTSVFWKFSVKWKFLRMMVAGLFGSGLTAVCLVTLHNYRGTMAVTAFFIVPLMLLLAFGWPKGRQFVFCVCTSLLSAVILNGTVQALCNLTGMSSLNLYICGTAALTAVLLTLSMRSSLRQQQGRLSVTLTGPLGRVSCLGFYDSGNLLTIPETGEPVHIISPELLWQLTGETGPGELPKEEIAFRTLGTQEGRIQVYRISSLEVKLKRNHCRMEPAWVGCSDAALMKGKNYQVILNAEIFNGLMLKERREVC